MTAELAISALNMALLSRKPESVIHHSDQGSQYTSIAFGNRCKEMGVRPSMGTSGDAYDNAMPESFFASLECELIARRTWKTKTKARLAVCTWIETWYNPRRRHSGLGQMSPINFEMKEQGKRRHPTTTITTTPNTITPDPIPEKDLIKKSNVSVETGQVQVQSEQDLADYRTMREEKMRLDPLTNVANRRALDEHVTTQWQRAMRRQRALSLLMIDVDHFKRYNDHYGHVEGDECLQRVAHTLSAMVSRADELVARYGGEEFAVLLPDTEAPQALALAQKMCAAVHDLGLTHAASDTAPYVTISIGVACLHPVFCTANHLQIDSTAQATDTTLDPELVQALDGALAQALFEQADAALYAAKKKGRNQAVLQPAMVLDAEER